MADPIVIVFLGNGQALGLTPPELAAGLRRGRDLAALGLGASPAGTAAPVAGPGSTEWVSPREAARRTGTTAELWAAQARDGRVPARKVGRYWRIAIEALQPPASERPTVGATVGRNEVIPWKR